MRIPSPCPADWEKMIGDDRVRHCNQCNLNVYNLSAMTGLEARELVAKHEGRLCLRFYHRKDGTILTQNCPVGLKVVMQRVSRVAGIALSAVMSASPLAAQAAQAALQPSTPVVQAEADTGLELHVVDKDGKACPGATIELMDLNNKSIVRTITDSQGIARLTKLSPGTHQLKVSSPEFESFQQTVWVREYETFKLEISKDPPLIETTTDRPGVTGGTRVTIHDDPQLMMTGTPITFENPPIEAAPPPRHGFFYRAFSKLLHPWH
ncbi:MAG TPA: carboxypeptidase-like regulatory domain-containing protein [Verrucomicrobiae bacterium]|nr:carboxypeptidase-like regulatory domain-containing protein [Verrucomicrobiae bacterium]